MDNFKKVLNKCIDHFKKHGCNEKADRLFAILNNKNVAIPEEVLMKLPADIRRQLLGSLDDEITEDTAYEIINS